MADTHFLIITALDEERDAVLAHLQLDRCPPTPDDVRVYYRGIVDAGSAKYDVVLVPLLGMGRVDAATATTDAIRRWRPRYVILVGIAGGIAAQKVSLGDVLLADQYVDYERQEKRDDDVEYRFQVHPADPRLLSAARNVPREWRSTTKAQRPDSGEPAVHKGPIATGDKTIASRQYLESLLRHFPKLVGVEMEAGGAAAACFQAATQPRFFMVRAVSDLADDAKDSAAVRAWRSYACDVAATFLTGLLRSTPIPDTSIRHRLRIGWPLVGVFLIALLAVLAIVYCKVTEPRLALQSVDTHLVEVAPEVYQLGLVGRVANLDDASYLLSQVSFEGASLDIAARGGARIRELHNLVARASLAESSLLRPNDSEYVKLLLPLRVHMKVEMPPPPEFVLWGKWVFLVETRFWARTHVAELPEFIGNPDAILTAERWHSASSPSLGALVKRKAFPRNFPRNGSYKTFLVFNPDSSATYDVYGFDQTNAVRSRSGTMVFLVGPVDPPLLGGWRALGSTYPSVWADPNTLAIYNSVFPPDAHGQPRPFGVFAGWEQKMGATSPVPTTRGRDIIQIRLLPASEYDEENPVFFDFARGAMRESRSVP